MVRDTVAARTTMRGLGFIAVVVARLLRGDTVSRAAAVIFAGAASLACAETATPTALPTPAQLVEHATDASPCLSTDINYIEAGAAFFVTTAGIVSSASEDWYELREEVNGDGQWRPVAEPLASVLCSFPRAVYAELVRPPGRYVYRMAPRRYPGGPAGELFTQSNGIIVGDTAPTDTPAPDTPSPTPTPAMVCITQANGIVECGDEADNLTNWELYGHSLDNTDHYRLYGLVFFEPVTGYEVQLYRDANRTQQVAYGWADTAPALGMPLIASNASGLHGRVDLVFRAPGTFELILPAPLRGPSLLRAW